MILMAKVKHNILVVSCTPSKFIYKSHYHMMAATMVLNNISKDAINKILVFFNNIVIRVFNMDNIN